MPRTLAQWLRTLMVSDGFGPVCEIWETSFQLLTVVCWFGGFGKSRRTLWDKHCGKWDTFVVSVTPSFLLSSFLFPYFYHVKILTCLHPKHTKLTQSPVPPSSHAHLFLPQQRQTNPGEELTPSVPGLLLSLLFTAPPPTPFPSLHWNHAQQVLVRFS